MPNTSLKDSAGAAPKARTRRTRASRGAQLKRCAIEAFAAIGIAKAGHADVARLAGVSVPAVFSYFPTREVLVDAVLTEVENFLAGQVGSAAAAASSNARDRLVKMIMNCAHSQASHPEYIRIFFNWGAAIQDPSWERYVSFFNRMIDVFESVLLDGKQDGSVPKALDTREAAHIIVGETNMIIMMMYAGLGFDRVASFVEHYVDAGIRFGSSAWPHKKARRLGLDRAVKQRPADHGAKSAPTRN